MMKVFLFSIVLVALLFGVENKAPVAPVKATVKIAPVAAKVVPVGKPQFLMSVVPETTKVVLFDTVLVVKFDSIKVKNTLKDTIKLISSDTSHGYKYDTLRIKKPVIKK